MAHQKFNGLQTTRNYETLTRSFGTHEHIHDVKWMMHMQEKEDGPLFKFYEVIMDVGGEFMETVNTMKDITLFAPSNEAWKDPMVQNIIR